MAVSLRDSSGNRIKRHLFVTDDPYDSRLGYIGITGKRGAEKYNREGERVKSKVYDPNHPRYQKEVYKREIEIS
jgi:hypothetical protein